MIFLCSGVLDWIDIFAVTPWAQKCHISRHHIEGEVLPLCCFCVGPSGVAMGIDKTTGAPQTLHYITCQEPHMDQINTCIEDTVAWMQATVEMGRSIRTKKDLALKQPLREVVVIHPDENVSKEILSMKAYIVEVG